MPATASQNGGLGRPCSTNAPTPCHSSRELREHVVLGPHDDRVAEIAAEQHRLDVRPAGVDRRDREQDQRHGHDPRAFLRRCRRAWAMRVRLRVRLVRRVRRARACRDRRDARRVEARLAVERQEQHPERVERGDEHAGHHREVRVAVAGNRRQRATASMIASLREEAGERRDARERERADHRRASR